MNGRLFIQRRQLQQPEHFHQAMVLFTEEKPRWQPVLDVVSSFLTKGKTWGSFVAYHVTQPMLKQGVRKSRNNQFR
jgi:hypothetical protein